MLRTNRPNRRKFPYAVISNFCNFIKLELPFQRLYSPNLVCIKMFSSKTRLDATYYTPRTTKFLIFSHILVILAFSASLILSIYILLKHDPVVKIIPFIWQIISGFISIICIVLICSGIAIWATRFGKKKQNIYFRYNWIECLGSNIEKL